MNYENIQKMQKMFVNQRMVTNFENSLEFKKCLQNKKHADFKTIHKIEKLKQKNREPEFFP